ncbi:uncharacterized protein [Panulirus ornatus]|uniref:uncharacterized protein n=1 Tax=Panulirus ornatus TaxID=150431 RepID=UPI003A84154A
MLTDDELSRLAEQAILKEAKRGAQRAEISGPSGWLKCKLPSTNKTFLQNTLLGALAANRVKEKQDKTRSEDGKRKREMEEREKNTYKRLYIHASTKPKNSLPVKNMNSSLKGCEFSKKSDKKTDLQRTKVILWNESGLELTNRNTHVTGSEQSELYKKARKKKISSELLPRSIKFIPSCNQNIHNVEER